MRRIRIGTLHDAEKSEDFFANWADSTLHDGEVANLTATAAGQLNNSLADTVLLVLVSVQVFGIAAGFILGFPLYMRRKIQQRKKDYRLVSYHVVLLKNLKWIHYC